MQRSSGSVIKLCRCSRRCRHHPPPAAAAAPLPRPPTNKHFPGITAPGLRALAAAVHADGFATFAVSAPAGERSAQSHCISVGKHLHAWELPVEGAEEAYAVDGTPGASETGVFKAVAGCLHHLPRSLSPHCSLTCPHAADSVMIALNGPLMPLTRSPSLLPHLPICTADSVMIALNGPLLRNPVFNLVVSGINRGDNW